jgi:hypothetical protein
MLSSIAASFIISAMSMTLLLYSSPASTEKNVFFSEASMTGRGMFGTRAVVSAAKLVSPAMTAISYVLFTVERCLQVHEFAWLQRLLPAKAASQ